MFSLNGDPSLPAIGYYLWLEHQTQGRFAFIDCQGQWSSLNSVMKSSEGEPLVRAVP